MHNNQLLRINHKSRIISIQHRCWLVISLLCFFHLPIQAQILHDSLRFIPSVVTEDLYLTQVNDLVKGSDGLLWLGTDRGLAYFDGTTVDFVEIKDASGSLLKNFTVRKLIKSKYRDHLLYLSTDADGLIEYNLLSGISLIHQMNQKDSTALQGNSIISLEEEHNGNFWVSTDAFCLSYYDRSTKAFTHFRPVPTNLDSSRGMLGGMVRSPIDSTHLWLGSRFGLYRFDQTDQQFTLFPFTKKYDDLVNTQYLELFADEQEEVLWLGKFNDGLWRYDPATGKSLGSGSLFSKRLSKDRNSVRSIYPYDQQTILISRAGGGFVEFDRQSGTLKGMYASDLQVTNLEVRAFLKDELGNLWLGAKTGLYRFAPQNKGSRFLSFESWFGSQIKKKEGKEPDRFKRNSLRADLFSADGKRLYLGTLKGDGLFVYHIDEDRFQLVRYQSGPSYEERDVWMDTFCEDEQGQLWIGTDSGLLCYNRSVDTIQQKTLNAEGIDEAHITSLALKDSLMYVGTRSGGIFCINHREEELIPFAPNEQLNLLPNHEIYKLHFDQNDHLWIGTNIGLFIYDPKSQYFLSLKEHTGGGIWLSELGVYDIIETNTGEVFISTLGDGLVSYDPQEKRWKNYRSSIFKQNLMGEMVFAPNQNIIIASINQHLDFKPSLTYDKFPEIENFKTDASIERSLIAFNDGRIWSGEYRGISEISILAFEEKEVSLPLYIKRVLIAEEERYTAAQINAAGRLELSYQDHTFSLSPGALNFSLNPKNYFFQQLEGIDEDWVVVPQNSRITYSNVAPGHYRYRYRAQNQAGRWTKDIGSFDIIIHPPWWRSKTAYASYTLLFFGGLIFARRQIIQREQLKNHLKLEKLERAKVQEIDQLRARFYANISHEFRTPLTLIKAPLEDLLTSRKDDADRQAFFQMHQNAERLLQLVHQLLDLSRLESGVLQLKPEVVDVYLLLQQLSGHFQSLAEQKQIMLHTNIPEQQLYLDIDQDKFEKIVLNLLSNAVKFAPKKGWVRLQVEYSHTLKIRVGNNGEVIPKEEQPKIFERFYQAANTRHQGTGIGLALVRELVQLHQGQVGLNSNSETGTWFWVQLPLKRLKKAPEITHRLPFNPLDHAPALISPDVSTPLPKPTADLEKPLVLLVEDHDDVRTYIREKLQDAYRIIEAKNGEAGLQYAFKQLPDLILSDLMMPKMDGLHFCQRIKEDHRTDHIPFILLTAKADVDSRLQGLSTGADDYLAKPFNSRELQLRINNLIEQRRKLQQRFAQTMTLEPQTLPLKSTEQQFIEKAIRVVEEQMDNPNFKVTDFSKALLLSRTHLHRKLKNLTGYGATDFIRHLRLQRAAQLLAAKADTVTQVAYQTGFNSQSYFTKCFKAKFGISPTDFREDTAVSKSLKQNEQRRL